jgi:AcrR family transcriptional regulator
MATRSRKPAPEEPPTARTPRARARTAAPPSRPPRADLRSGIEALRGDVLAFKRERILQEAAALFYERGYMQTTMEAIAERMGATKPFVYYHFESKTGMLVEICERATAEALAESERALQVEGSAARRFEAFVRAFTRTALKNHEFVAIYFREEFSLPEATRARINQMRKTLDRRLRALLAEGAASGEFDVDDAGMTALVVAGMASYAFAWYRESGRLGLEEATEQIVRMAVRTVAARTTPTRAPGVAVPKRN